MESLVKSLLGKGQEHIYETMQTLIEDAEKVNNMDLKLKEITIMLENKEDENQQNKKMIRDLKSNLDHEKDMNEELEDELERKEDEIRHLKKCVENRDDMANGLEEIFKERAKEIDDLRSNCESLARQVGKELILEKKVECQNKVIKELKDNLINVEKSNKVDSAKEIENLVLDIKNLEIENEQKVKSLVNVDKENDMLVGKLKVLEENNKDLMEKLDREKENVSLDQELSLVGKFECKLCEKKFATRNEIKLHDRMTHETQNIVDMLKRQLSNLEKEVTEQKFIFLSKVLTLKECERKKTYLCSCKARCSIHHEIYNWTKPKSDEILAKSAYLKFDKVNLSNDLENEDPEAIIEEHCNNPWGLSFLDLRVL